MVWQCSVALLEMQAKKEYMKIITQSSYKTTTWKGGVTRQIFISPADGDLSARLFDVRISSAIIDDVQSDFSALNNLR